jgi:subtilisin-like proprotein convertase family protein
LFLVRGGRCWTNRPASPEPINFFRSELSLVEINKERSAFALLRAKGERRKKRSHMKTRAYTLFSFLLLFALTFSLIANPIAALGADAPKLVESRGETRTDDSPAPMIPNTVFSNAAAINIPDSALSSVQSNITVSGMAGTISSVTLTLNNFTANAGGADFDILLVGPGGQKFMAFSDVGGLFDPMSNATITLSDAAASLLPSSGSVVSGTFKPTDYGANSNMPSPAPAGPYQSPATAGAATFTSVFGGLSGAGVNGTWTLYVADDTGSGGTGATIAGGWSLDITTAAAAAATTTTIASSLNPSNTNQAVTFTSTTTSSTTVNTGTVTFTDSTTGATLCSNVAVNGSGVATCLAAANTLTERRHTIQATYNANATFATSNGSLTQTVNFATTRVGNTFTNSGGITIPDAGGGTSIPYPSNIIVTGLTGTISKVTLTLTNANFPQTADYNFLLVGPSGQTFLFMSDAGGLFSASTGVNLTFDDAAASQLPNSGSIASGTYRPTDYVQDSEVFPSPAPAAPYGAAAPGGTSTFASVFGGAAPNGTWSLYPLDDTGGGSGSVGSWSLTFTTSGDSPTTTTLTSSPNPSTTAQAFTLTATVTSSTTVNVGTVTFRQGATVFCANVAVNASGVATCNVPAQPQGDYVFTADYNGSPGQFNISSGSVTQQVNSPTVVTCLNFANNGGMTIPNSSFSNPYPARINVSGLGGTISKVTLSLNGLTAPTPDDVDFLLVGPGGQTFIFMSDAGGANALSGVNITLDDAAATALPDSTAISSGTWRPASYAGGADAFPAPAPAGPYNRAATEGASTFASVFNGISPNGTWSLYAVEDAGDALNTTLSGWSLTFTLAAAATTTTVTSSANPSVFGQPVTLTATVATAGAGTPTGNVQFFDGATPIGGAVALNGSGQAQVTTSTLSTGNHTITAQYAGASNACTGTFNSSSGNLSGNPQVVNKANTTTGISSSGTNPVGTNVPVTFTATVSPVAPGAGTRTGTVTFFRNGSPVCSNVAVNGSGQATCNLTFTIAGNYNITASYSGDTNFNASNNNASPFVQQVVGPTAAGVSLTGRVVTPDGSGIPFARVRLADASGTVRMITSNPFGYYQFGDVPAGATYVLSVEAKGYQFDTPSMTVTVSDNVGDLNFVGHP